MSLISHLKALLDLFVSGVAPRYEMTTFVNDELVNTVDEGTLDGAFFDEAIEEANRAARLAAIKEPKP